MKRWFALIISIALSLYSISLMQAQDAAAWEILDLVNQARNQAGVHSLTMNQQLMQAAQRHSDDMAATDTLTHTGSDGSEFWQRMGDAGYSLTTGAENVLMRWDSSGAGAFDQWLNSPPHRENYMNAAYVEVGIAYAQASSGAHYFTMVLGARPGVEPPAIIEEPTPIPPSPVPPTPIPPTPLPPTATLPPPTPIPPTVTQPPLPSATATMLLPSATATFPPPPTFTPAVVPARTLQPNAVNPTPQPPNMMIPNSSGNLLDLTRWFINYWRNAARVQSQPVQPAIPSPTLIPTLLPTAKPVDLLLLYNAESFTLVNVSGRVLGLGGLLFRGEGGEMAIEEWDTEFLTQSLTGFTPDDCLQAWTNRIGIVLEKPDICQVRHSWITVSSDALFWQNTQTFSIIRDDRIIAVCSGAAGVCQVNLSDSVGTVFQPTPQPPAANQNTAANQPLAADNSAQSQIPVGSSDVRLIYSPQSFALLNTSGRTLDISQLAFESDNGVMVAGRWNIESLSAPLFAFPAGGCLQAWAAGGEFQAAPDGCDYRHAWVAVSVDQIFWVNVGSFRVRRGAEVLATCGGNAGTCDFAIP